MHYKKETFFCVIYILFSRVIAVIHLFKFINNNRLCTFYLPNTE